MKTSQDRILWLLERYANRSATEAELRELTNWMATAEDQQPFEDFVTEMLNREENIQHDNDPSWDGIYEKIRSGRTIFDETNAPAIVRPFRKRWLIAASVTALLGISAWIWNINREPKEPGATIAEIKQTIPAGRDGAVLTLADGTQLVLDSLGNGVIATESGVQVVLANGQLNYQAGINNNTSAFNSMTTPKGRQFRLQLPDGTKVWLNAASSIRYPVAFDGNERRVEINGEAYFEVAPDKNKPFYVNARKETEIKVLGTSFNITAYDNEDNNTTTLLQGSVAVSAISNGKPAKNIVLEPGQLVKQQNGQMQLDKQPDLDKIMAWKNGIFYFENMKLEEMMRQLERWYDIEVKYEGNIPDLKFIGKASRKMDLSTVLTSLKGFGLNFRIENNKTLIITP